MNACVIPTVDAGDSRLTEFYDDYLNGYEDTPPVPEMQPAPTDRVAAWARQNPGYPPSRQGSRSAPGSSYTPSSYVGGSMRRKPSRRPTIRSRIQSSYEEEEEGYGSGEYEDGPLEMSLIRVKVDDASSSLLVPSSEQHPFTASLQGRDSRHDPPTRHAVRRVHRENHGQVREVLQIAWHEVQG